MHSKFPGALLSSVGQDGVGGLYLQGATGELL